MLKSEKECSNIKKYEGIITCPIAIDGITSLLIGEREFYYYLIKYDKFLKTILKILWISEQEKGNNIKVKVIGKNGNQTYIDYDHKNNSKSRKKTNLRRVLENISK